MGGAPVAAGLLTAGHLVPQGPGIQQGGQEIKQNEIVLACHGWADRNQRTLSVGTEAAELVNGIEFLN